MGPSDRSTRNMPSQLILHFLRDVSAKTMREAFNEGFALNATKQLPAMNGRIASLNAWMAEMHTGQRLIFSLGPA